MADAMTTRPARTRRSPYTLLFFVLTRAFAQSVPPRNEDLGDVSVTTRELSGSSANALCVGWRMACEDGGERSGCYAELLVAVPQSTTLCTFE
jgi:hypothetical protein